jgi:hypothetical protein
VSLLPPNGAQGEFPWRCERCPHLDEAWTTELAAQCAATWHVFEQHYEHWVLAIGARPPRQPRPEMVGRALATWERRK